MFTIAFTWPLIKVLGIPLFVLSVSVLFGGSMPDHHPNNTMMAICDWARWLVWPAMFLWVITFFIRGLVL